MTNLPLDETGKAYVRDLAAKRAIRKEAEAAEKRALDRLKEFLGDAETASFDGEIIVERVRVTQRRFDSKRFKADHPELDEAYRTETSFERVDLAEGL